MPLKHRQLSAALLVACVLVTLILDIDAPDHWASASGSYYFDFDSSSAPPVAWTAGGDPLVSGYTSSIYSDDSHCPANGTHYDGLLFGSSPNPSDAVWLVKSFTGDGLDAVSVSWAMRDEGSSSYNNCNPFFNTCYGGYYIGSTAPTSQSQFTILYTLGFQDQQWHEFGPYSHDVSGNTVYVAFL